MTLAQRLEKLIVLQRAHPLLACRIANCPRCQVYYRALLTPDTKG